jgi:oligopeptide/dipeptide ABC transporter ATP-binding protein
MVEADNPLLNIYNLQVSSGQTEILKGISLTMKKGEILGIAGESGCGKSTLLKSLIRLLAPGLKVTGGGWEFDGMDLQNLSNENMRRLRGRRLTLIFQNATEALNHTRTIGQHFVETMRSHGKLEKKKALAQAAELMESLNLPDPERLLDRYPFELSGGMNQRVVMALAMILRPDLMLADEPTSALDAAVQAQAVGQMLKLRERFGAGILIVTHNLGVLAHMAETVGIMYAGSLVEYGRCEMVLENPAHPYTQALIAAVPDLDGNMSAAIEGSPPEGVEISGCYFFPRCQYASPICAHKQPELKMVAAKHQTACHQAFAA